jgi:peroxiredoxin Q/BCP
MTAATAVEGAPAPDFRAAAASATGEGEAEVTLAGLRGQTVVLYFYPKDDTPGCTVEAQGFRDHLAEFTAAGAVVLGVSRDSLKSHARFCAKYALPFPLLADPDETLCRAYGVLREKTQYGRTFVGVERSTFLIDGQGVLRRAWRQVKVDGHVQEVLTAVRALASAPVSGG